MSRSPGSGMFLKHPTKYALETKHSGLVWNGGIENRGIQQNTGIGYECIGEKEERKTSRKHRNRCLEHRNPD
jgi:hypothetical protein